MVTIASPERRSLTSICGGQFSEQLNRMRKCWIPKSVHTRGYSCITEISFCAVVLKCPADRVFPTRIERESLSASQQSGRTRAV